MKRITFSIFAITMAFLVSPNLVFAQQDSTGEITAQSGVIERKARIDTYKEKVESRITAAEERRISAACRAAQGLVNNYKTNLDSALVNRRERYLNVTEKLDNLVEKLQSSEIDISSLEASVSQVEAQISEIISNVETYKLTISDMASMDCEEDPVGFKATLEAARVQRTDLLIKSNDLKTYLNETLKPTLSIIRAELSNLSKVEG